MTERLSCGLPNFASQIGTTEVAWRTTVISRFFSRPSYITKSTVDCTAAMVLVRCPSVTRMPDDRCRIANHEAESQGSE
jgi:hypothetical protein